MIRRLLSMLGLVKKKENKILTVVTHFEGIPLHLCVDYYEKNEAMFGKKYPGIALGWGIQALRDAMEYALNGAYDQLVVEKVTIHDIVPILVIKIK